jgi:CBS domain-containing protein/mannitol/fructose-specific phosphotransferase system IIA component (Ntr-type)
MRLAEFLPPAHLVVPLAARTLPAAASVLLERLVEAGAVEDPGRLRIRIEQERPEDLVAMGDRAFLLHYRTDAVSRLAVAMGTASDPIERALGEGDAQRARIVLLVAAPPRQAARYLQVVGAFARVLAKPDAVDQIAGARDAQALSTLPLLSDYRIPEQLAVRDVMTDRPRSISPDIPLATAARDLVRLKVGALPVIDENGIVIGVFSQRELMRHLLGSNYLQAGGGKGPPPGAPRRTVRDVMTRQVLCVAPEQPLAEVASMMTDRDVERVPVVRDGRLVGVLTRGDIVRKLIGP